MSYLQPSDLGEELLHGITKCHLYLKWYVSWLELLIHRNKKHLLKPMKLYKAISNSMHFTLWNLRHNRQRLGP